MKKLLSIIAIALIGAFVLSSCNKEYETEPLNKVKVTGKVEAKLDLTSTDMQSVPNGTTIIFRTNSRNLCQSPDDYYDHSWLQIPANVNNGQYEVELPAVNFKSVTYEVDAVEFETDQKQTSPAGAVVKKHYYVSTPLSVDVQDGERKFLDITYSYN